MNPSFVVGRYMCPKNAQIISVDHLDPFEPYYQPHNASELVKLVCNLGNESCVIDQSHSLGRPDAKIKIIRVRHAIISGWQPLCAFIRLHELPDVLIICWNNFRALTLFRYMIQSGMRSPKELQETGTIPTDAKYRKGIWSFYSSVRESVLDAFSEYKTQKLIICGHSLGGMLGTAFAADVIAQNLQSSKSIWLYIYGSPRCANQIFCQWLGQHLAYGAHVQMERDICCHLTQAEWISKDKCESYENVGEKVELYHEDRGWHQNHSIDMYKNVLESQSRALTDRVLLESR